MAKLQRKTQKVFCSSANADQIAVFGSMKTGTPVYSSDVETLQSAEYLQGWDDAILSDKAPYMEEMNGVQFGLSYQIAYLLQEGAPEYDANTEYSGTSIVKTVNGNELVFYRSLLDGNIGHALTDTTYWTPAVFPGLANVSLSNLDASGQAVLDAKADTGLTNITSAATKKFDGQWVNSNNVTLSSSKSSGSQTISLSSYLPSDGYNYEVLITAHLDDDGSSYKYGTISSSIISNFVCAEVGDYSDYCINTFILPVGTNRQITWWKSANIARDAYIRLHGYRRIGTNS